MIVSASTAFVADAVLIAAALLFAYTSYRNYRLEIMPFGRMAGTLTLVGFTAAAYAAIGMLEIVTTWETLGGLQNVLLLCYMAMLVVAIRECFTQRQTTLAGDDGRRTWRGIPLIEIGFVVSIVGLLVLVLVSASAPVVATAKLLVGIAILAYGTHYSNRLLAGTRISGTAMDTLLRHLVPILFLSMLLTLPDLAILADGIDPIVTPVETVVVTIVGTTFLFAASRLHQNVLVR